MPREKSCHLLRRFALGCSRKLYSPFLSRQAQADSNADATSSGFTGYNHNGEIYQALTDRGIPVEYVIYPREGHGISEPLMFGTYWNATSLVLALAWSEVDYRSTSLTTICTK